MLCPTIAPQAVEDCAAALAGAASHCIDAPMSGGPLRARDGTMSLMVACADAVYARWQGLLQDLSTRLFRIGTAPGDGARTKLVNNLLAAVNLAGAAEAMALAEALGLDPAATLAVIEQSSGQSWIGSDRMRRALAADPSVQAHLALLAKDSALAIAMASEAGAQPPLGRAAAATFAAACADGLAAADDSCAVGLECGAAQPRRRWVGRTGKRTVISVPGPVPLARATARGCASATEISAPCCSATSRTIARPRPLPSITVSAGR